MESVIITPSRAQLSRDATARSVQNTAYVLHPCGGDC